MRACGQLRIRLFSETLGATGCEIGPCVLAVRGVSLHLPRLQQLHILLLRRGWIANASWLAEPHRLLRRKSKKQRKADSTLGTPMAVTAISTYRPGLAVATAISSGYFLKS